MSRIPLPTTPETPTEPVIQTPPAESKDQADALTLEDLENFLTARENKRVAEERKQQALAAANSALTEAFGDRAAFELEQVATKLGTTKENLQLLAETDINLFKALIGKKEEPITTTPPTSNNVSTTGSPSPDRGHSYYEELKVKDRARYNDPKTVLQQEKDMIRLGERYFEL